MDNKKNNYCSYKKQRYCKDKDKYVTDRKIRIFLNEINYNGIYITYNQTYELIKNYIKDEKVYKYQKILDLFLEKEPNDHFFNDGLKKVVNSGSGKMHNLTKYILKNCPKKKFNNYSSDSDY